MAKNITIGNINFTDINKIKIKETNNETYAEFISPDDADVLVEEVVNGKTFYAGNTVKKTGAMTNLGAVLTDISTKAQEVAIAQGYHNGSGKIQISSAEQAKIIASNIKAGMTILGQAGSLFPTIEITQIGYDNLSSKDSNTYYIIVEEE